VNGLRNVNAPNESHLRRSDVDGVSGSIPIPGLQVSEKNNRAHFAIMPWDQWSAALLEIEPPPWWTPSSPSRMREFAAQKAANNASRYNHIEVDMQYGNLKEEILTFPERRPREFNIMLAIFKTWVADAVVQLYEGRKGVKQGFDWRRSIAFALFGLVYIGLAQWFLYVSILTWLFPDAMIFANAPLSVKLHDTTGMLDMAGQIAVDLFIIGVFIYFPVFYVIKAMCQETGSILSRAQKGLGKYWTNIVSDNLAYGPIWIPADVVIFSVPMYLRMPLEHLVSIGWTMFMSATRGATEKPEKKMEAEEKMIVTVASGESDRHWTSQKRLSTEDPAKKVIVTVSHGESDNCW